MSIDHFNKYIVNFNITILALSYALIHMITKPKAFAIMTHLVMGFWSSVILGLLCLSLTVQHRLMMIKVFE